MHHKNTLLSWLGLSDTPKWTRARFLGPFLGALLVLLAIAILIPAIAGLIKALAQYAFGGAADDTPSEAVRNIGLLLIAIIAFPLTVYRLKLTFEQNKHNENVLFNDKLHQASIDLHAQRQVSKSTKDKNNTRQYVTVWEDDIIRRNGAIDRLESLAVERPETAPDIARILCVYLREMTRAFPAEKMPDVNDDEIWFRAKKLKVKRSDMEVAAQVLGNLRNKTGVAPEKLAINLAGVNLQAMRLNGLDFEYTVMETVYLDGAQLENVNFNRTDLWKAKLNGAHLDRATFNDADLYKAKLNHATLYSATFNKTYLNKTDFSNATLINAEINEARLKETILDKTTLNWAVLSDMKLDSRTSLGAVTTPATALRRMILAKVPNLENKLGAFFGDASVQLPDNMKHLVEDKWPNTVLNDKDYNDEWSLFKKHGHAYKPPQHRRKN